MPVPTSAPTPTPPSNPPPEADDTAPGVPGFRTWRSVYLFVLAAFILIVIALTLFTRAYA